MISGTFGRDNNTIRRTTGIAAPVLLGLLANEMTQLTMGLDPGGFRALTLIGYVLDGEVDFTSRFDIWGWLC